MHCNYIERVKIISRSLYRVMLSIDFVNKWMWLTVDSTRRIFCLFISPSLHILDDIKREKAHSNERLQCVLRILSVYLLSTRPLTVYLRVYAYRRGLSSISRILFFTHPFECWNSIKLSIQSHILWAFSFYTYAVSAEALQIKRIFFNYGVQCTVHGMTYIYYIYFV